MFELIEDNKKLLLILLVLIFIISSIYINLNTSIKTKHSKTFEKYQHLLDKFSKKNLSRIEYGKKRNKNMQQQQYYQTNATYDQYQQPEIKPIVNNYQDNISKDSIEDIIKNVKTQKKNEPVLEKIDNHTNTIGNNTNKSLDTSFILESANNLNRITDLIQFKMNPTQNISPNMENNISMIKTGCNKTQEYPLSGFDGIWDKK